MKLVITFAWPQSTGVNVWGRFDSLQEPMVFPKVRTFRNKILNWGAFREAHGRTQHYLFSQ